MESTYHNEIVEMFKELENYEKPNYGLAKRAKPQKSIYDYEKTNKSRNINRCNKVGKNNNKSN